MSARRAVTVVTGAGRGIGAATALHLARTGHDLALNYLSDQSSVAAVLAAIRSEGARAVSIRGDVADHGDVEGLFDAAAGRVNSKWPHRDGLIWPHLGCWKG